jgi:glycosyltransferase involved in cell wall biosynthesis
MKILFCDPVVNTPTSIQYKYYDGVFNQLPGTVLYRKPFNNFKKVCVELKFKPDLVVFGLGWFNHKFYGKIEGLEVPSVCVLFKPQNDLKQKLSFCKTNNIDRVLTPVPAPEQYAQVTGCKTVLFPYGFDPEVFRPRDLPKAYDIGFTGALHEDKHYPPGAFTTSNLRTRIGQLLTNKQGVSVLWNSSDDRPSRIPSYEEYAKTINSSKMWIATQAAFGDVTPRFYEVLGSGTLLFCQKVPTAYRHILKPGVNCVEFKNDLSDFEEKLDYYLSNPEEVDKITSNAVKDFAKYTWENRAKHLLRIAEELI